VPLRASRRQLEHLNYILLYTIAQVDDYADRFPQERQIYLIPHPEEHSHGNAETFQRMRAAFKGKIQVVSPMTGRSISGHAPNYTVTPNPVSQVFWERSRDNAPETAKKDILLAWKDNESGQQGLDLIKSIRKRRPNCSLTVWAWSQGARAGAQEALPGVDVVQNISESDLCDLYHQHHMFLYPSNFEGFGIPPIEALASGSIPILRPEVGAAEMYARDGKNSIFIGGGLEDVAERVAAVLEDSETMTAMQANGYESIEQFNPNGYGVKILTDAGII
jgi:glycosyltransferase involved in cell wall biosynthesis